MAHAIVNSELNVAPDLQEKSPQYKNDVTFAAQSCAYLYSYMAITAFVSVHLYEQWQLEGSFFRNKYPKYVSFEKLMREQYRELKDGLRALCEVLNIPKIHEGNATAWQHLIEFMKNYRDFFVHPTPDKFSEIISGVGARSIQFPVNTAVEIIGYFYDQNHQERPDWLNQRRDLKIPSILVESTD